MYLWDPQHLCPLKFFCCSRCSSILFFSLCCFFFVRSLFLYFHKMASSGCQTQNEPDTNFTHSTGSTQGRWATWWCKYNLFIGGCSVCFCRRCDIVPVWVTAGKNTSFTHRDKKQTLVLYLCSTILDTGHCIQWPGGTVFCWCKHQIKNRGHRFTFVNKQEN